MLNAANPDVNYPRTEEQIKQMVCEAISTQNLEAIKDKFVEWNERGCTANESDDNIGSDRKDKNFLEGSGTNSLGTLNKDSGSGGCFIANIY
jgi:hypothetical protein